MKLFRGGKDAAPAEAAEGAEAPATARGSSNLVPALVVAAGLVGGGFLFSGGGGEDVAAAAAPTEAAHAEPAGEVATHGPVQNLEPITLNLSDGRFLKVGLALQLAEAEGGHGEGEELPSAKALDIAISLLGTYTMDDLRLPKDRELVKKKLSDEVSKAYIDPVTHAQMVTKVYFTEFVMQ